MRTATIALACGLLALAPGCGGDDEEDPPPSAPALTVPRETDPGHHRGPGHRDHGDGDRPRASPSRAASRRPSPSPRTRRRTTPLPRRARPRSGSRSSARTTPAPAASRLQTCAGRRPRSLACWCRLRSLRLPAAAPQDGAGRPTTTCRPSRARPAEPLRAPVRAEPATCGGLRPTRLRPGAAPAPALPASAPAPAACWGAVARAGACGGARRRWPSRARLPGSTVRAAAAGRRRRGRVRGPLGPGLPPPPPPPPSSGGSSSSSRRRKNQTSQTTSRPTSNTRKPTMKIQPSVLTRPMLPRAASAEQGARARRQDGPLRARRGQFERLVRLVGRGCPARR